jgi:hypothetical protein
MASHSTNAYKVSGRCAMPQRSKYLTADATIKFMMATIGNQNSEMARELHTALKLRISQLHINLSQVLQYLQSGAQDNSELFQRLSKDTTAKIILGLIKHISPSENDEQNSTLEDQHGTERQCSTNSFQNKKLPHSNEVWLCVEDSAVNQHEHSSGKNDVNCVNCALLNVKLQNVLQEFKFVRLIIALLQEDMNILKEEHRHDDTVPTCIHNYEEGTFSSVNGKS